MNLLEQQVANRRRTWLVMIVFALVLAAVGAGLDLFIIGGGATYLPIGTLSGIALGGGSAWFTMRNGDRAILGLGDGRAGRRTAGDGQDRR